MRVTEEDILKQLEEGGGSMTLSKVANEFQADEAPILLNSMYSSDRIGVLDTDPIVLSLYSFSHEVLP